MDVLPDLSALSVVQVIDMIDNLLREDRTPPQAFAEYLFGPDLFVAEDKIGPQSIEEITSLWQPTAIASLPIPTSSSRTSPSSSERSPKSFSPFP